MKETIIVNLLNSAVAELTKTFLSRQYPDFSFKAKQYYSEFIHMVTYDEVPPEKLLEMQAYARGVSDVLGRLA